MGDKLSASPDFVHEQYQIDKSMSDDLPFAIPSAPCKASCHRAAVSRGWCCKWYFLSENNGTKGIRNWYLFRKTGGNITHHQNQWLHKNRSTWYLNIPDTFPLWVEDVFLGAWFASCIRHPFYTKTKKSVSPWAVGKRPRVQQPKIETCGVIFSS